MSAWTRIKGLLGLLFLLATGAMLAWELWEAATTGAIRGRHHPILMSEEPGRFWSSVAAHVTGAVLIWGLFAAFVVVYLRRPGETRKLDAWLRRQPSNQLNPPPVRRPKNP